MPENLTPSILSLSGSTAPRYGTPGCRVTPKELYPPLRPARERQAPSPARGQGGVAELVVLAAVGAEVDLAAELAELLAHLGHAALRFGYFNFRSG